LPNPCFEEEEEYPVTRKA